MLTGDWQYVFPSLLSRDRPMSDNTINSALRRLGYSGDEQTGHGFRSMASTLLNEQGFPPDVIEYSWRTWSGIKLGLRTTGLSGLLRGET